MPVLRVSSGDSDIRVGLRRDGPDAALSGWVAEPQEVQEGRLTLVNPLVPSSPRHPKRCLDHPAEELKVKISIETVWNNFITTPEQLIEYVDSFHSPWVAAYFDCSNMLKYGVPAATWIRKLGKRMVKFDFKGYHGEELVQNW